AEERGQAEAIAKNLYVMSRLAVPIVSVVIGEGGSGGALALGVADRVIMLEHSIYSVISPEGCAAILWDDPSKAADAAATLRLTARDLLELKVIDEVVPEPVGGAHRDSALMADRVAKAVGTHLSQLRELPPDDLLAKREQKYRAMGSLSEPARADA
ncbi:MAG TPA: acetyl-CoA carboxylase carboxyl transferase subunit alpha, partial [Nitrospirales bacterium]|nr:acetyl-CoA carboxylase carboxyl transferase subunit alpha [Nitrospirales bacterium]